MNLDCQPYLSGVNEKWRELSPMHAYKWYFKNQIMCGKILPKYGLRFSSSQ